MMLYHLIALTIAVVIDLAVGDPPSWPHPVKWIGSLINQLEKGLNNGELKKLKGLLMLITVLLTVGGISVGIVYLFYSIHPAIGILAEAFLISSTIAQKSLKEAALTVYDPLEKGSLPEAREKLSYIVGRDTDQLGEPEIVRAAVETVAENISDGITAPLFWALIGGAPLALIYRAVNTCDSMVGYRNDRYLDFGWASARFDDVLNLIPSRLTSICILLGNRPQFTGTKKVWEIVLRDAKKHPSPNSGWGEAAVAAILGVQLGGVNYYKGIMSVRATMGPSPPYAELNKSHILKVNQITSKSVPLFLMMLWLGGMFIEMAGTWI